MYTSSMSTSPFHSDRTEGPKPRDIEVLPKETKRALLGLVQRKIKTDWFAEEFPKECEDGKGIAGTNRSLLQADIDGLIPNLAYPLASKADLELPELVDHAETAKNPEAGREFELDDDLGGTNAPQPIDIPDSDVFDLLEYTARKIALPRQGKRHDFYGHHELRFDGDSREEAQDKFREEVNELLGRGGVIYNFNVVDSAGTLQIQRMGNPEVRRLMADLQPNSGDKELDDLIIEARERYLSHKEDERRIGLEKLWDAFERLKTVEPLPDGKSNKKASAEELLRHITDEPLRKVVEDDMAALTAVGNQFRIRHHETDRHVVPVDGYDYLFARMSNVIITLLRASNRLAK